MAVLTPPVGVSESLSSEDQDSITAHELYQIINRPNNAFILDVRQPEEFEEWRIEGRYTPETVNIPYFAFFDEDSGALNRVPKTADPVIVVCGQGAASDLVASLLDDEGYRAVNLTDGMEAWGNYYAVHVIAETESYGVYQIERPARGCLSHVLVSEGQAAIIDPLRHTDQYLDLIREKGAELRLLLDTHAHADHISGGFDLQERTAAPYYLHPYDGIHPFDMLPARKPYHMLDDGMTFDVGGVTIEVIHTPGHTLGQVNFLAAAPDGRRYLFTGDNIFIESFGRPDLGGQGERWAPLVYETIFEIIKTRVPGDALVLPGHYARADEANEDGSFAKPLDALWRENKGLQHADREEFIQYVLNHLPFMPEQYIEIKRVNAGLSEPDEETASTLELGKNICALSDAY